jgi:hypothetical protein
VKGATVFKRATLRCRVFPVEIYNARGRRRFLRVSFTVVKNWDYFKAARMGMPAARLS